MSLRRTLIIALAILAGLLLALLYAFIHIMVITRETRSDIITIGVYQYGPIDFAALAFTILAALPVLGVAIWVLRAPGKIGDAWRSRQKEKGIEALEDALIAAAGGDGRTARREARRAANLLQRPAAPRLIAAQSAESLGDVVGAESQYAAMLADPKTQLVGRRGLSAAALSRHDYETAILHAARAFETHGGARWAFDLLFDAQVRAGKWSDALITLSNGAKRGHLPDDVARRRRAVLLTAEAAAMEGRDPSQARELSEQAASLSPAFAPGVALAARLAVCAGKGWRASSLVEDAWSVAPHPALSLSYRDIKPDEATRARVKRMLGLAELNPEHRESRILRAEQALTIEDPRDAEEAIAPLLRLEKEPSARLCGLLAQIADAMGDGDQARHWLAQAAVAPAEPDWSDLDPEGPAFDYQPQDWGRMTYSFGDTGQLIHPRHERFERPRAIAAQRLLEAPPAPAPPGAAPPAAGRESADDPHAGEVAAAAIGPAASPFRPLRRPPDDPGV